MLAAAWLARISWLCTGRLGNVRRQLCCWWSASPMHCTSAPSSAPLRRMKHVREHTCSAELTSFEAEVPSSYPPFLH